MNEKGDTEDLFKMARFVLKNNSLNLIVKLNNNFLGLPLVPSLRLHRLVYLWINLKLNFLSRKYKNLWYGFGT